MKLSIIILNYKTPDLTIQCIDSVLNQLNNVLEYEILVADNASNDGSIELLKQQYNLNSKVTLIENEMNIGFARGNNELAKIAKGEFLLLLNSDTIVTDSKSITDLISVMESDKTIGISACKLLNEDLTLQISFAKLPRIYDLANEYLLGRLTNRYKADFRGISDVETVIGAFMIIRKDLFLQVGMFDDRYYFNVEDIDLCAKVLKEGLRIIYNPDRSIIHLGGKSQGDVSWVNNKNLHENRIKYYNKHYNRAFAKVASCIINKGVSIKSKRIKKNEDS
jgi:GT2 family glycosyltransferase